MLEEFLVHPLNFDFQGDAIAEFLRRRCAVDDQLARWTIALPSEGSAEEVTEIATIRHLGVKAGKRKVTPRREDGSLLVSGRSARVGGRADLRHAFDRETLAELQASKRTSNEDDLRAAMRGPLLVIYLLRGVLITGPERIERSYRDGLLLPALGMHFPGSVNPDAPQQLVSYRLNKVAQRELFREEEPDGDDIAAEDDDVD